MNGGNVQLLQDGKTIIIEKARIVDEELYKFFYEIDRINRMETLVSVLKTGYLGTKRMINDGEIDFIEKKFDMMVKRFEQMFDPQLSTSFYNRFVLLLKEYFNTGGTVENILQNGPISKLKEEVNEQLQKIHNEILRQEVVEEYQQKSAEKGYRFEDEIEEILSKVISKNIGDELKRTTNETGAITDCLIGDFIVKFKDNQDNIVIETKDCQSISFNQIKETLEKAMKNRNGKYAIMIVRNVESLPKFIGFFNEFHDNKMVVALESKVTEESFTGIINIALQWARLKLRKEINLDEEAIENVENGIAQIREKLNRFSVIKTQCSNINKATSEIYEIVTNLREEIKTLIEKIQNAIISTTQGDDTNE